MTIKIQEIREYLLKNPQSYSSKNSTDILNIKSGHKYYFIGDCKHEFLSLPYNAFGTGRLNCPYCCGRRVLKGFNDIWTTNPEIAILLENAEEGYKYTVHSNKKLIWGCRDCNKIFEMSPNKLLERLQKCPYCSETKSYGEKFLYNLLEQLYIAFDTHKIFDWSDNKQYDFFIPEIQCIIEINGKQHYTSSDFSYKGGRTYYEESINDAHKKDIALKNGILHYIIIDARNSNINWLKHSICNSDLLNLLAFNYKEVDWELCNEYALTNETKLICQMYEKIKNIHKVADYFHCSYNTVKNKLKQGAASGWCSYDAKEAMKIAYAENGHKIIESMSKSVLQIDKNGNIIQEFPSIQEAQRRLNISHIWDCAVGRRNTAGRFVWRYKGEDNEFRTD